MDAPTPSTVAPSDLSASDSDTETNNGDVTRVSHALGKRKETPSQLHAKRSKQVPSPDWQQAHHSRSEPINNADETAQSQDGSRQTSEHCTLPPTFSWTMTRDKPPRLQQPKEGTRETVPIGDLLRSLSDEVCESGLAKETVKMILNTNTERKDMLEAVQHITSWHIPCPRIDERSYLFSDDRNSFSPGMPENHSLITALGNSINTKQNSLDLVFRKALREIALEINTIGDENVDNTLEKPMFISARYLELTLLQKIRAHYMSVLDEDIVSFYTRVTPDGRSKLPTLVEGSACDNYIRLMFDRYSVRWVRDFDRLVVEEPLGTTQMRVWTNKRTQAQTALFIRNHIMAMLEEMKDKWHEFGEDEKQNRETFVKQCSKEHATRMFSFLIDYKPFLEEILRTSELMAWVCFGVVAGDHPRFDSMVTSYMKLKTNGQPAIPFTCWNYPLARIYSYR